MRNFVVQVEFPEVLVKDAHQTARVQATSWSHAVKRCLAEILKRPGIKGKRLSKIKLVAIRENGDAA